MKRISFFIVLLSLGLFFFVMSCSKSNADTVGSTNPPPPDTTTTNSCDTANMKYMEDIVPILQNNCYSCHGSSSNSGSGGIVLEGYSNLLKWTTNGYLAGEVTHASGYIGMPYGEPKLPSCTINQILSWINNGAQNN